MKRSRYVSQINRIINKLIPLQQRSARILTNWNKKRFKRLNLMNSRMQLNDINLYIHINYIKFICFYLFYYVFTRIIYEI